MLYRSPLTSIPAFLDVHALLKSQYWSQKKLGELQDKHIEKLLFHASKIPSWKNFIRDKTYNREALQKLPVTSRRSFDKVPTSEYTDAALLKQSIFGRTSGTTGRPFEFYHDRIFELFAHAITERTYIVAGGGKAYPVISARTRNHTGSGIRNYHHFHVKSFANLKHRIPDLLTALERHRRGVILAGYSSWISEMTRLMQETSIPKNLRGISIGGEEMDEQKRAWVESTLGAKIFSVYAMSEGVRLAFECEHRSFHINEEWAYLEILDDQDLPVPEGKEGRIVVTVFSNFVMPFIRYDSGDRGIISSKPCACGRTLRTITFRGRQVMLIAFSDGRTVSYFDIAPAFSLYPGAINEYRLQRTSEFEFTAHVIPGKDFEKKKQIMEDHVTRMLHPKAVLSWNVVSSLEKGATGKSIYYVDSTK